MGVPGLWPLLGAAEERASLAKLAEEAFQSKHRGLRVGVDYSLWLFHGDKAFSKTETDIGPNPGLRMQFFRVAKMLGRGILPLFVFDGASRPTWKRGKRVGGRELGGRTIRDFTEMLDAFGIPWRTAPGEAEAELAWLAREGLIDAVLSDDVDTLLFGIGDAMLIRNDSPTLTANVARTARLASTPGADKEPTTQEEAVYYRQDTVAMKSGFDGDALVLMALLAGEDYNPEGLVRCGLGIAAPLAKAGFGKRLLDGIRTLDGSQLDTFLESWRQELSQTLKTNPDKMFAKRPLALAEAITSNCSFPNLAVVQYHIHPLISSNREGISWDKEIDFSKLVPWVSRKFEWPNAEIRQRLYKLLCKGILQQESRRNKLNLDATDSDSRIKTRLARTRLIEVFTQYSEPSNATAGVKAWRAQLLPEPFLKFIDPHLPLPEPVFPPRPSQSSQSTSSQSPKKIKNYDIEPIRLWISISCALNSRDSGILMNEYTMKVQNKELEQLLKEEAKVERAEKKRVKSLEKGKGKATKSTKSPAKKSTAPTISTHFPIVKDPFSVGASPGKKQGLYCLPKVDFSDEDDLPPLPAICLAKDVPSRSSKVASTPQIELDLTDSDDDVGSPPPKAARRSLAETSPSKTKRVPGEKRTIYVDLSAEEDELELQELGELGRPREKAKEKEKAKERGKEQGNLAKQKQEGDKVLERESVGIGKLKKGEKDERVWEVLDIDSDSD